MRFLETRYDYFVRCADARSLSVAAKKIGISHAALSLAIKSIEREVGTPLFVRGREGVTLTPRGKALLEVLQHAQRDLRVRAMNALDGQLSAPVKVGSVIHYGIYHLLPAIERSSIALPKIQHFFTYSLHSFEAVRSGKLDFAFVSWTSPPRDLKSVPVRPDKTAIVGLRKKFPQLAKIRNRDELAALPWVVQIKPQYDWTEALPSDWQGFVVRDQHAFKELILRGSAIGDVQVDMFKPEERRRLVVSSVPPTYPNGQIYAVYSPSIRPEAMECLKLLLRALGVRESVN